ncbi:hypothetical protein [Massilia horti]|uniref:Integrase catalytic domain-containing protein n=1 Tax=Massilia horti TaxID=2562153 RepID=A0A4Y9T497_9BURK|nr:hypothetical protein [Massilia horti]TFW31780.1 hypothetical protein E4O92_12595 [Massilia horti]
MTQGRRRVLIPYAYTDTSKWPEPDIEFARADPGFAARRRAVEMYADGESAATIFDETGKDAQEVRRLVKRCISQAGDGEITGFYALLKGWRPDGYKRTAAVQHVRGGGSGGCAGALRQLFDRYPDVEEYIRALFLPESSSHSVDEVRIPYMELHGEFTTKLRELGLTDDDWPFNTENVGYKSLRKYCISLLGCDSARWIRARSGEEAARRTTVGNGQKSILPSLRAFGAVQLDFHLVDAASIIVIENAFGVEIDLPLRRWYFGLLVEEKLGLVIGVYIALELNPSSDSVLEVIESALRPLSFKEGDPRCALIVDKKVLPNQMFPELEHQCFSVLKMDNAKCNTAAEVVSNIIDTVGCAVNFGPIKAWWRRDLIERVFGALTRRGLQRLPSTYGSGPGDTRRSASPNQEAVRFRIMLNELVAIIYGCIREHNETRGDTLQKAAPIQALQAAMRHPASGFLRLPLPKPAQEDLRLMAHVEEVTVRGNLKKNVRPYVNIGRWRYTSPGLAQRYDLIEQKLIAYCDRRSTALVRVTVKDTGEDLGWIEPPRKWAGIQISFRDRALINSAGYSAQLHENGLSTVRRWVHGRADEITKKRRGKSKAPRCSKDALALARIAPKLERAEAEAEVEVKERALPEPTAPQQPPSKSHLRPAPAQVVEVGNHVESVGVDGPRMDPFGLNSIPDMHPIERGD